MRSSTASCTRRTALPSTARPCANHRKNPPNVASLTPTPPSEPLKPSTGSAVRDHRNAVRDRSESLSAIHRKPCPQSPESADKTRDVPADLAHSGFVLHHLDSTPCLPYQASGLGARQECVAADR